MSRIELKMWADARKNSGRVLNPRKHLFLKIFAMSVIHVSKRKEKTVFYLLEKHLFVVSYGSNSMGFESNVIFLLSFKRLSKCTRKILTEH